MNLSDFKAAYQNREVEVYPHSVPDQPIVSVLVQTYEHAGYIEDCLNGILEQKTNFPVEILLGEDDSSDGTREICRRFAENHPDTIRLFLHRRENNIRIDGQPTGRFNLMFNLYHARGRYVAFCEGDDYWSDPSKLQRQVDILESEKRYSGTYTNYAIIDEEGEVLQEDGLAESKKRTLSQLDILGSVTPKTLTVLLRRSAVPDDLPAELFKVLSADTYLFAMVSRYGLFHYSDFVSGCYRVHGGGMWSLLEDEHRALSQIKTCHLLKSGFQTKDQQRAINRRLSSFTGLLARICFGKGDYVRGLYYYGKAFMLTPGRFSRKIRNRFAGGRGGREDGN